MNNYYYALGELGLRKSLEIDSFQHSLKKIRKNSFKIIEKGN